MAITVAMDGLGKINMETLIVFFKIEDTRYSHTLHFLLLYNH